MLYVVLPAVPVVAHSAVTSLVNSRAFLSRLNQNFLVIKENSYSRSKAGRRSVRSCTSTTFMSGELRGKDASVILFTQFYPCVIFSSRLFSTFSLRDKFASASTSLSSLK